ncbi:MAG: type II toxin-antitoxin system VapC family toxin [Planctomycetota bacterium]
MVLLDTCALFWWVAMPDRMSVAAARACRRMESEGGVVSSISFWELGVQQRKGKIDLGVPFDDFCDRVRSTGILEIVPVTLAIWQESLRLPWEHRDPADRVIVATARLRGLPIVTADEGIRSFHREAIW